MFLKMILELHTSKIFQDRENKHAANRVPAVST